MTELVDHLCIECGETFTATARARYCPKCRVIRHRMIIKEYNRAHSKGNHGLKFGMTCERCKHISECRSILWTQAPLICFAERKKMHWRTRRKLQAIPAVMMVRT